MKSDIQRVDRYDDRRFSQKVLCQHGAFYVDGEPYEIEIVGCTSAQVRGAREGLYKYVIEEFHFYAGHICEFYDVEGKRIAEYPPVDIFAVKLSSIQPSQFLVDTDKIQAVRTFIHKPEDVVIPVTVSGNRYISQDGHTRLAAAVGLGFDKVNAFINSENSWVLDFSVEAQKRGIHSPYDLKVVSHREYEIQWNQFCDKFFMQKQRKQGE